MLLSIVHTRHSLYYSNNQRDSNSTFDCLYAYMTEELLDAEASFMINYHLIPYCRRFDENGNQEKFFVQSYENVETNITFADLYRLGITSSQLLEWSAPIDVAELYEKDGKNSNEIFHNCSVPWFGSTCQYRFDIDIPPPFSDVLEFIIRNRSDESEVKTSISLVCYPFLTGCYRGPSPMCLDWHEICDGKFDCLNGEDEESCQLLELNECSKNEFRCHYGGQCIPFVFVRDGKNSKDCLDGSDEQEAYIEKLCMNIPTFRCEEAGHRYPLFFSCGDGDFLNYLIPQYGEHCGNNRDILMTSPLMDSLDYIRNFKCRKTFDCILHIQDHIYNQTSPKCTGYESFFNDCFSEWVVFPEYPILFNFFQFVYFTNRSMIDFSENIMPDLICFNASQCPALLTCSVDIGIYNGLYCCRMSNFTDQIRFSLYILNDIFEDLIQRCLTIGINRTCSHPSLFHCSLSSKCISKYRLADGRKDCYYGEDELFSACQLNDSSRFICESETNKCLSIITVGNGKSNCRNGEDEWSKMKQSSSKGIIPFALFCDQEHDLSPTTISNETDETHCQWWPCNTPNVRCDNTWHCLNGNDELNCPGSRCSFNELACRFDFTTKYACIPINHLVETYINRSNQYVFRHVYIENEISNYSMNYFRWNETKCITAEQLYSYQSSSPITYKDTCLTDIKIFPANGGFAYLMKSPNEAMCILSASEYFNRKSKPYLKTSRIGNYPLPTTMVSTRQTNEFIPGELFTINTYNRSWTCNRGIFIFLNNNETEKCLCPPSYFGELCQWQSQRISLTLQLIYRTFTYFTPIFQVLIMLIDDQGQITPYHEQILYVPKRDCNTKYNLYLLYPDRPKNISANYSIRIDIFDKINLQYWSSWHLSIPFQFLPVNRIATQLFIPTDRQIEPCSLSSCGLHGRCIRYINKNFTYFCQCDQGYSGLKCHIQHNHSCSSDSFSLTSSICICPLHKFGRQCYLKHTFCQLSNSSCLNNGVCVPIDDRIDFHQYSCLCKQGFYGKRCEYSQNRIDIKFDDKLIETIPAVLVHFISAFENVEHQHTTLLKRILFEQNNITLFNTQPFHILFIELFNQNYYLSILREKFLESELLIETTITSKQRCLSIDELMNNTLKSYTYLHQIKYYPLLCRENPILNCFYDKYYMCICDLDRFSNCFLFNHNRTYDCQGYINCENNAQCFQDNITCPSVSICVCLDCYYGTKCQFSTKGAVLSLDYILGYHIKPNISFTRQPLIIKISVVITSIMLVLGLINGFLSISTFRKENTQQTGCGFYLLISSWISIIVIIVLIIKFWQLILSQMAIITNRLYLKINCILLDMIINVLLTLIDWLDVCVSIERVITVTKGLNFNKNKSKQLAKWITLLFLIFTILTLLPDLLYRDLIDDINEDEQRTWCIVQSSSVSLDIFNIFITFVHFLIPFFINLISIIIIIISISRFHSTIQRRLTFKEHLKLQFKQNKQHLITLFILVLLALPRLIISFASGCMKSPNHSWLFLSGYLMAFLPSLSTVIIFILPSKTYKDELNSVIHNHSIRRLWDRFSIIT